jgi:HEAT repeat protein
MQDVKEEKTERSYQYLEAIEEGGERSDTLQRVPSSNRSREFDRFDKQFSARDLLHKSDTKKSIILGAPGSGKTTLLSYFAVSIAQEKATNFQLDNKKDWLPILIRMRDFVRHDDMSILSYYQQFCHNSLSVPQLPTGFFEYWLEDGRAIILLDGLDEIVEEGKRYAIVQKIDNFLRQFNSNRVIITSRPEGYRKVFFDAKEYPCYWLRPFDDRKISQFLDNWFQSRVPDRSEATRRKEKLQKILDRNNRIKLLASNPLLLTIIVLISRYQEQLPRERYKIYEMAIKTLLISWDTTGKELEKCDKLEYLKSDDWEDLLQNLAYWIHTQGTTEDSEGGTVIDKDELIEFIANYVKNNKNIELSKAKGEANRFINFIRERTGLINEQATDSYAFVHKTFQEYLCAQKVKVDADEAYDFEIVLKLIDDRLHNAHWREVLLLLIAQQGKKAAKAIRHILERNSEYERWLHRDLLFCGDCLAENPKGLLNADGGLALVTEILTKLVDLEVGDYKQIGYRVKDKVKEVFCNLGETNFEEQALILLKQKENQIEEDKFLIYRAELGERETVITLLIEHLTDSDSYVRLIAVDALGKLDNGSERVIEALLKCLTDSDSDVRSRAAYALSKLGNHSERVIEALLKCLIDSDSDVRSRAAYALSKLGNHSERVIEALLKCLIDSDSDVRSRAAYALGELGNGSERVIEGLLRLLPESDSDVRSRAAYALSKLGNHSERVIEALLKCLIDSDSGVRSNAVYILGKLGNGSERLTEGLLGHLTDPDSYVRLIAVDALGKWGNGSERVIEALLKCLTDSNSNIRVSATDALSKLDNGSERVIEALLKYLIDSDSGVRSRAANASGELRNSSERIIEELLGLLADFDYLVRLNAVYALGKLGKKFPEIIPSIDQWIAQHQESEYIRNGIDALWMLVCE